MDRKTEIKKDLYQILKDVYKINPEVDITSRQEEFLSKAVDYLDANISLRRKVVKEKKASSKPLDNMCDQCGTRWCLGGTDCAGA